MSIQDTLAANMRRFRKTSKLSQEKLAEIAGLHRTYIGGIEQRRINVSLKNIGKIADALGVKPMLLFADLEATGVRSGETANGEEAADSIADTMEASESIADDAMTDNSIAVSYSQLPENLKMVNDLAAEMGIRQIEVKETKGN